MFKEAPDERKSFLKSLVGNLSALAFGLTVALLLGEIITRIVIPIFPGTLTLGLDGERLEISEVQPNAVYRQFSEEFDVVTTITKDGYRIPEAKGNPDIVFIGDSFTFGQGLKDEDTFIMQYCSEAELSCMNLGVPGSGTITEIDRLEKYLTEYKVRPKKVYLSMLVMTSFLGAGNDLNDNLLVDEERKSKLVKSGNEQDEEHQSTLRYVADTAFRYSNFARVVKFYLMPFVKNAVVIEPEENQLELALKLTKNQLNKLEKLSKEHQFEYRIILFHPVQDISRGTHLETTQHIQNISPIPVISSANLLEQDPHQYYFSLDGHFNKKGSDKIVELLHSMDNQLLSENQ